MTSYWEEVTLPLNIRERRKQHLVKPRKWSKDACSPGVRVGKIQSQFGRDSIAVLATSCPSLPPWHYHLFLSYDTSYSSPGHSGSGSAAVNYRCCLLSFSFSVLFSLEAGMLLVNKETCRGLCYIQHSCAMVCVCVFCVCKCVCTCSTCRYFYVTCTRVFICLILVVFLWFGIVCINTFCLAKNHINS